MKKAIPLVLLIFFLAIATLKAQVLNVSEVIQEHDQWCWAGVTACVLDYYDVNTSQCSIAEYTRSVATWHNFGTTNCCVNAEQGCDFWNYNWGYAGSIQDILVHFAYLSNTGISSALSLQNITSNIQANRLFIIRWGWTGGGGHFIVGHGITGNNVYYMNPWRGEGKKVSTYAWLCSGDNHTWTSTNILTNVGIDSIKNNKIFKVSPNPVNSELNIEFSGNTENIPFEILNTMGQVVYKGNLKEKTIVQTNNFAPGMYLIKLENGKTFEFKKIIKE